MSKRWALRWWRSDLAPAFVGALNGVPTPAPYHRTPVLLFSTRREAREWLRVRQSRERQRDDDWRYWLNIKVVPVDVIVTERAASDE